jgi:hypothetical protein
MLSSFRKLATCRVLNKDPTVWFQHLYSTVLRVSGVYALNALHDIPYAPPPQVLEGWECWENF